MQAEILDFLSKYGYWAIFSVIFIQELGVPSPAPNEVVLLFAGYLASIGKLSFPLILLSGIAGDFIGTIVLYSIFYYFGKKILKHAPKWLPVEKIEKLQERIKKKGNWGVFLGRLLPYLRGYSSIAAGLLKIPPRMFIPSVIASAIIWSGSYVIAGRLIGEKWRIVADKLSPINVLIILAFILIIFFIIIPKIKRYYKNKKTEQKLA
ncbi:MAG: DedA family protein [Candidatus Pacebacteria bacterium]|nr:DedA family protein [Candidatus Paceibacterota bacterium]